MNWSPIRDPALAADRAADRHTIEPWQHPDDLFHGVVQQVRLDPIVEQNVVTYAAVISAPNPSLKLRPGMTANVTIEVARRDSVLRVPAAALRFRPTAELLADVGQADAANSSPGVARANQSAAPDVNTLWLFDGTLKPVSVRVGVSDGTFSEIVDGAIVEGSRVVTRVALPADASAATPASGNPLMGSTPRRF